MSEIKTYTLNNYKPGVTTFEVALGDIFTVPEGETLRNIDYVSISNTGITACTKNGTGTATKFIFTPTSNIKEPNHKYDVTVKFTLTTEVTAENDSVSTKTRNCFIKLILTPEINDDVSKLNVINYMGKLSPDEYMKEHSLKDDLDSLVTKKALITNLKEFGKQISNKVSNVQVFAIRYDLDGGNWDKGNEGRTSFVNSISYVAPAPVKTGYIFNGWKLFKINDDKDTATALNASNISTDSMIPVGTNFDALCVADWSRITYELKVYDASDTLVFNPNAVDYSKNLELKDVTIVEEGEVDEDGNSVTNTITLPTPTKNGYTFKYWTTTDKYGQTIICKNDQHINEIYDQIFDAINSNIDRVIELRPYFEAKVYTLNYNLANSNAKLENGTSTNKYIYGTTYTLPIPRLSGHKFEGWTIGNLVKQFIINPTDLEDITDETVEVKATWSNVTFHLDFDLKDGIITENNSYTLEPNKEIILANPTRVGYTFDGWIINDKDGKITLNNTTKEYKFTPSNIIDHDVTLVAKWEESNTTTYTLQVWEETLDSAGTFTSENNDTCVYRLIKAISKTGTTNTTLGLNTTNYSGILGYEIPKGFALSKVVDATIKADGTSIVAIYIHRNICNISIKDTYDTCSVLGTASSKSLYRSKHNTIGDSESSTFIKGKYGQTLLVYPIFNSTYPELAYTCNTSGVSLVFGVDSSAEFVYTKKNVKVTFDLNSAGSWKVNSSTFNSDIYSIDVPYGAKIDVSHTPTVTNHKSIKSSKWTIESDNASDSVDDSKINEYTFTKDTRIRRTYTYYNNQVNPSIENYDESLTLANMLPAGSYKDNKLSDSIRPIELLKPSFDAYNFVGYKYKFGTSDSFSNNYITAITRDIWPDNATARENVLYLKACFERKEPTLDLTHATISYSNNELTIQAVDLKAGATKFYLSSTVPNANVSTSLGNESTLANDGTAKASINGSFAADSNHNTIVIIPAKTYSEGTITGKPFIGTIAEVSSSSARVTVTWVQSYQVYDNQDDASISGITATNTETHTRLGDKTSITASTNAEKVLINKGGALSIAEVSNNRISIPIDNYSLGNEDGTDLRNQESTEIIQLTPIKHNKTGKSAILDIKKVSTFIKKTESDIIAFADSDDYYDNLNYTKVSDTLGLSHNGTYNNPLTVTSGTISIDSLTSTAPNTNKNKKLNSITYSVIDNNNYVNGSTVNENNEANELGISLYANSNGTSLQNLFYTDQSSGTVPVEIGRIISYTNRLVGLSNVTINLASVDSDYNERIGTIKVLCKSLTYHQSVTNDNGDSSIAYYSIDDELKVRIVSDKSISTPSISSSEIINCASNKYFKITLGDHFYTVDSNGNLTRCTAVYVKCSDLNIDSVSVDTTTSQATTNICGTPDVSKTNDTNSKNKASFIKKDGGQDKLSIDIPITIYNSITYRLLDKVGDKLKTVLSKNNALTEQITGNNTVIRNRNITKANDNNYITWYSIALNSSNKIEVTYNYASVRRDYESYLTTIEGQYL